MTGTSPDFTGMDPTRAGRELSQWAEQLQRKAETFQHLQQQMGQLTATETSSDGAVRVTVDSQGVPTELTVTERGMGTDAAHISAQLMVCLRRAQSRLSAQVRELVHESVPGQDDAADRIVSSYQDRFPEEQPDSAVEADRHLRIGQIEDEETGAPPPRRQVDPPDHGDGWDDQTFLR